MKRDRVSSAKKSLPSRAPKQESAPGSTPKHPPIVHLCAIAALVCATFVAYSNSLHTPFLMDNEDIILKDNRVHAVSGVQLHRILTQQYWETSGATLYRP